MGAAVAELEEASAVAEALEASVVGLELAAAVERVMTRVCVVAILGAVANPPPGTVLVLTASVGAADAPVVSTVRVIPLIPFTDTDGTGF
jgi:hypothetical protein